MGRACEWDPEDEKCDGPGRVCAGSACTPRDNGAKLFALSEETGENLLSQTPQVNAATGAAVTGAGHVASTLRGGFEESGSQRHSRVCEISIRAARATPSATRPERS